MCFYSCWFSNEILTGTRGHRVVVGTTTWWPWICQLPATKVNQTAQVNPEGKLPQALLIAQGIDMFTRDVIFLPVNLNQNHWVLAVLVNIGHALKEEGKPRPPGFACLLLPALLYC